jgi:hypothetical protein
MTTQRTTHADENRSATSADIRHVLGELEDTVVAEILSHRPSFAELSAAALWARGDGDLTAREHMELSAPAIAIAEILTREDQEVVEE